MNHNGVSPARRRVRRRQPPSITQKTGPIDIVKGKRILVVADAQNLDYGARDLGYRLSWSSLRHVLSETSAKASCHAVLSTSDQDRRRLDYLTKRGWTPHAKVMETSLGPLVRRKSNADFLLAFVAGLLASRGKVDIVVVGSGDGDLVEDVAEGILGLRKARSVVTLSLAGSTAQRLNHKVSSLVSRNMEIGLDCLRPM